MRTRLYSTRGRRRHSHHVGQTGAPTVTDLLLHSAWFPTLDSAAQQRVMDDVREIEVPHAARHAARL